MPVHQFMVVNSFQSSPLFGSDWGEEKVGMSSLCNSKWSLVFDSGYSKISDKVQQLLQAHTWLQTSNQFYAEKADISSSQVCCLKIRTFLFLLFPPPLSFRQLLTGGQPFKASPRTELVSSMAAVKYCFWFSSSAILFLHLSKAIVFLFFYPCPSCSNPFDMLVACLKWVGVVI